MNPPVPITKIKITKEKWLMTKIKYDDDMYIKDILEEMAHKSYEWVNNKSDIGHIQEYDSFKNEFINLMYDKYYKG